MLILSVFSGNEIELYGIQANVSCFTCYDLGAILVPALAPGGDTAR